MTETTNNISTTEDDPIDHVETLNDIEAQEPSSSHHLSDLDDQDDDAIYSDDRSHDAYQSSHADQAEFFDNEASQHTDTDLEDPSSASKSGSIVTAATGVSSTSHGDTLAPLPEASRHKDGNRASSSAAFSIPLSEIDSSYRSNDLQTSMYNRLAATALEEAHERKAQLCCGSCCDLIKGSIIANSLQLFSTFITMAVVLPNERIMAFFEEFTSATVAFALAGVSIVFSALGIFGAARFYKWPVLVSGLWNILGLISSVIERRIGLSIFAAFFAYPNIHLFLALHTGKITRENYILTERYCCCRKNRDDDDSFEG